MLVSAPRKIDRMGKRVAHPTILDSCFGGNGNPSMEPFPSLTFSPGNVRLMDNKRGVAASKPKALGMVSGISYPQASFEAATQFSNRELRDELGDTQ
jgi:hypothetical protein